METIFLYLEVNKLNSTDIEFISNTFTEFLYKKKYLIINDTKTEDDMKNRIIDIFKNQTYKESLGILFNNDVKSCKQFIPSYFENYPLSENDYFEIYDIETFLGDKKRILFSQIGNQQLIRLLKDIGGSKLYSLKKIKSFKIKKPKSFKKKKRIK